MIWTHHSPYRAQSLQTLCHYFPHASVQDLERLSDDPQDMTHYLAKRHDLTQQEVREQLEQIFDRKDLERPVPKGLGPMLHPVAISENTAR